MANVLLPGMVPSLGLKLGLFLCVIKIQDLFNFKQQQPAADCLSEEQLCNKYLSFKVVITTLFILLNSVSSWGILCYDAVNGKNSHAQVPFTDFINLARQIKTNEKSVDENLERNMILAGRAHLDSGGAIEDVTNLSFLSRKYKFLFMDYAALKRDRPTHRPLTPMEQNAIWETEFNDIPGAIRSSRAFPIEVKVLPPDVNRVSVNHTDDVPEWLLNLFVRKNQILYPLNPFNSSKMVPYLSEQSSPHEWMGYLTASRTMIVFYGKMAFSVKMPTDYTNPRNLLNRLPEKADMKEDVMQGILRSQMIEEIDKKIGKDPRLIVLRDVLTISDPATGNGVTVKDLSPLMDGFFYLPGTATFSVMKSHGDQKLEQALRKSAANQGMGQALLLLRYGLEMEYPHRQNSLDRLDTNMQMLDTVVFRDTPDTQLVRPIAEIIAPEMIEKDTLHKINIRSVAKPNTQSITSFNGLTGNNFLRTLSKILIRSYERTISEELNIPERTPVDSPVFIEALKKYHTRK